MTPAAGLVLAAAAFVAGWGLQVGVAVAAGLLLAVVVQPRRRRTA